MRDEPPAQAVRRWLSGIGDLSLPPDPDIDAAGCCPYLDWAACGAMALTGDEDGPPLMAPGSMLTLVNAVSGVLARLTSVQGAGPVRIDPALLLGARAGTLGLTRRGRVCAGGATRLLPTADGWCALTLSRPDDLDLVPAILERGDVRDPWSDLADAAQHTPAAEFVARVRLFAVPAAVLPDKPREPSAPWRVSPLAPPTVRARPLDGALVVDLSSMWAGPLCARLLGLAGARVVKVESTRRPDGARAGDRGFYDWLHAGHESVAVDFTSPHGRAALAAVVRAADVVIEASRPRALAQLGLAPEQLAHRPGTVWISITGYGRGRPDRVAFGDDAAVAGGLVGRSRGRPVFCADAIADPLTGLVAALGAAASVRVGGGQLIDVSMRDVAAAFAAAPPMSHGPHRVRTGAAGTVVECAASGQAQRVLRARAPIAPARAADLGADTDRVLARLRPDLA
ncbi:CoA transferase [Streptomyces sp. NPDC002928]|uniref:CoA transferase n=1 Tax=Streptomyces sp. NPDC002928 TaxID=3154440 RepID=UPI0033A9F4C6